MANEQKTPIARTLPLFAQRKAREEIAKLGMALPGTVTAINGSLVTVNFEVVQPLPQVQMPLFGPEYIRYPVKIGDKGVAFPASVYIGGVSGLGVDVAANINELQANLSTLVWFPCGNKNWSSVDPTALTLYAPNGVVMRDTNSQTKATLTPSGFAITGQNSVTVSAPTVSLTATSSISLTVGGHSIVINSSGVTIDGKVFLLHMHTLVQSGSGDSGPVF